MMTEKVKHCPFCGGKAYIKTWRDFTTGAHCYAIMCTQCGCWINDYNILEEAIEAWNKRTYETN